MTESKRAQLPAENEPAKGEALDTTEYRNARRGYAACALTDILQAQFELALARFKAGELDYANEVEDVLPRCWSSADRSPSWRTAGTRHARS